MIAHPHRAQRALGLFGLLVAIYFATYTGQNISTDELKLYDAAHSIVQNGTLELAYTNDLLPYATQPNLHPVVSLGTESMQAYVAAPILWLAQHIPGIGLMQTVWLMNIFITALIAVMLFYFSATLGYAERVSIVVALLYGLSTIAWPYSQFFFREPLFTLLIVICAYALEQWRRQLAQRRWWASIGWLIVAVPALGAALLTKEAGLLLVPPLILIVLPGTIRRLLNRRILLATVAVIGLAVIILGIVLVSGRFADRLRSLDLQYTANAIAAYLFSPGFSLWAFSPVLLLGLPGAYRLMRQRQIRYVGVPLAALTSLVIGYSTLRGSFWYGGTGWGARFLVPAVPFLALWLLPIAELLLERTLRPLIRAIIVGIIVQSVFIQLIAVIVPIHAFSNYLFTEGATLKRPISPWEDGTWNPLYIPQIVNAQQSPTAPSEIAWIANGTGNVVLPLCLLAATMSLMAVIIQRRPRLSSAAVMLSLAIMLLFGLRSYYHDRRFGGDNATLWKVLDALNQGMKPGDAILLNNKTYQFFFMNYYKLNKPIYELPDAPGEQLRPDTPPQVLSDNPEELAHRYNGMFLSRLALFTSRWWYLTEYNPFSPGRLRVTEYYLARHYFPSQKMIDEPDARLLLYAPISAPPDSIPPWPEHPITADYRFASLIGYDLPHRMTFHAGDMLPVSLLWRHNGWPEGMSPFDYGVNVALIDKTGASHAQHADIPVGSFGTMSQWLKGGYYRDNHALPLPDDLPAGDYELWALIYDWRDGKNLPIGTTPADHVVLTTIHIN